jgi:uncharacterized delta-60 repeat protein
VLSNGKVLIGGDFESYNGTPRSGIARLNADGSLDTTFNPGTGPSDFPAVLSVTVQSDGKVLIGGFFTSYNGTPRNYVARLNADGTLDPTFNPGTGADEPVYSVAVQSDGKVLIGGDFTSYNGTSRSRIARLNGDGTLDTTFNPGTGATRAVYSVALQKDGKVLVGGDFSSFDGIPRAFLVRLHNDPATEALTVTSSSRVQWLRGGAGPELEQVTFEASNDGGSTWVPLGAGTRINGGWEKTGLNLASAGTVRARGRTSGGALNGSSGIVETVANYALPLAYSRKSHAGTANFDIPLPLAGTPGIECRTGGSNGNHQIVVLFPNSVTFTSAAVTSGSGSITSATANGALITINLASIANAQTITVTLFGINDGTNMGDLPIRLSLLRGDTNSDGNVNSGDAVQTRNRSGQTTDATNFRSDVNVDGSVNSGDAIQVRAASGTSLGAAVPRTRSETLAPAPQSEQPTGDARLL